MNKLGIKNIYNNKNKTKRGPKPPSPGKTRADWGGVLYPNPTTPPQQRRERREGREIGGRRWSGDDDQVSPASKER